MGPTTRPAHRTAGSNPPKGAWRYICVSHILLGTMHKQALLAIFASVPLLAASLTLTKPEDVSLSSERLKRIHPLIQSHIDAKDFNGAVTLIARQGKVVHLEAHGLM